MSVPLARSRVIAQDVVRVAAMATQASVERRIAATAGRSRLVATLLTVAILTAQLPSLALAAGMPNWNGYGLNDYQLYVDVTRRWMSGGPFYEPYQLAGPYGIEHGAVLYPPVAIWLFAPFTVLPTVLWWAIPITVTAWCIWRLQPGPLAWPVMALCLWGPVQIHIISGNPDLWVVMFVALGTLYRWPAVFAFLKPSLGIVALFGIRHRSWWLGLAAFSALSLPFLPMWFDWVRIVLNGRGGGLFYSWQEVPLTLIPIIAWLARPGGRYGLAGTSREGRSAARRTAPRQGRRPAPDPVTGAPRPL